MLRQWKNALISFEDRYIIGVNSEKLSYMFYIWNSYSGELITRLSFYGASILDVTYHPTRALIVVCSTSGHLVIWSKSHAHNWAALPPGFIELDNNVEYIEKENEFDILSEIAPINEDLSIQIDINSFLESEDVAELLYLQVEKLPLVAERCKIISEAELRDALSKSKSKPPQKYKLDCLVNPDNLGTNVLSKRKIM